jgi:hypothetical protein
MNHRTLPQPAFAPHIGLTALHQQNYTACAVQILKKALVYLGMLDSMRHLCCAHCLCLAAQLGVLHMQEAKAAGVLMLCTPQGITPQA